MRSASDAAAEATGPQFVHRATCPPARLCLQVDLFKPIMHTLSLIWRHSGHYNTPARFATLLREMCNDLIMQVMLGCLAGGGWLAS